jgi:glycosyltransferase involved in cell wall biosynthesis
MNTVAIAGICKNEHESIDRYVAQALSADAIYILDTGSTDGTFERLLELQEKYPNLHVKQQIFDSLDYAAFRNAALTFVNSSNDHIDYIFHVDIDECITEDWRLVLNEYLITSPTKVKIFRTEMDSGFITELDRIFKNLPGRWFFALHEGFSFDDKNHEYMPPISGYKLTMQHYSVQSENKCSRYNEVIDREWITDPAHYFYFYFLHIYSNLKDYGRLLGVYDEHKELIKREISFKFRHLIYRYTLFAGVKTNNGVDIGLLDSFLQIRNKSTLFTASKYCEAAGLIIPGRIFFNEFLNTTEDDFLKFSSYVPDAYDEAKKQLLRGKLFA